MVHTIAEHLFTVAGILSPPECEGFIARGEQMGFESASVSTTGGPKMLPSVRNNDRAIFDEPDLAASLWERIRRFVPPRLGNSAPVGLNERFRYYRYDAAQWFNAHRDGSVERSPAERSRITFMIYLNAGFEGGQTVFYSEDRVNGLRQVVASVEPVVGMALIFAHEWWHEGARVTSGRKYVLRTDVMYRDVP